MRITVLDTILAKSAAVRINMVENAHEVRLKHNDSISLDCLGSESVQSVDGGNAIHLHRVTAHPIICTI